MSHERLKKTANKVGLKTNASNTKAYIDGGGIDHYITKRRMNIGKAGETITTRRNTKHQKWPIERNNVLRLNQDGKTFYALKNNPRL